MFFFCKQKTAYEMRISDWSSDVCSSDLTRRMTAARRIGVRQLVHQYGRGAAAEDGIDVHLGQRAAEIFELTPWNDFEWLDQCFGLGPAVGFDNTDDDIEARAQPFGSLPEHFIGLADTGRGAERSEERRGGKEGVSTVRYRVSPSQ